MRDNIWAITPAFVGVADAPARERESARDGTFAVSSQFENLRFIQDAGNVRTIVSIGEESIVAVCFCPIIPTISDFLRPGQNLE